MVLVLVRVTVVFRIKGSSNPWPGPIDTTGKGEKTQRALAVLQNLSSRKWKKRRRGGTGRRQKTRSGCPAWDRKKRQKSVCEEFEAFFDAGEAGRVNLIRGSCSESSK